MKKQENYRKNITDNQIKTYLKKGKLFGISCEKIQEMINSDKLQIYHWKIVKGKYPAPNQNVVGYKLFRKPRKG